MLGACRLSEDANAAVPRLTELVDTLERRASELEGFTRTVAHEIRGPLVTVKGFVRLARTDLNAGDLERLSTDLARVEEAVDMLGELLDDLLELASSGTPVRVPRELALREVTDEAMGRLAGIVEEARASVVVADEMPHVMGDRTRLVIAFQNLLENALKFSAGAGEPVVTIGARSEGDDVVAYFSDNGVGISRGDVDRIFDVFERLDVDVPGSGVGLPLVRRIVEAHGGRVWAESDGPGKGATFYLTLPGARHTD